MKQQTNLSISCIRAIAMLLIVLYHSFLCYFSSWGEAPDDKIQDSTFLSSWWECVVYIALSLFMFISGFLFGVQYEKYRQMGVKSFALKKGKRLLLPYVIFGMLFLIVFQYSMKSFVCGIGHVWFLLALFDIMVISFMIIKCRLLEGKKKYILLLIWLILFYLRLHVYGSNFLAMSMAIYYSLPFWIGVIRARTNCLTHVSGWSAVLLMLLCSLSRYHGFTVFHDEFIYRLTIDCVSSYFCVCFFNWLKSKDHIISKYESIINRVAGMSMGIYLIHQFFISYIVKTTWGIYYANEHHFVFPLCLFLFCLVASSMLTLFLRKTCMKYIM